MNHKMVIHTVGQVVLVGAGLLLLPLLVSIYYHESATIFAYLCAIAAALLLGGSMFALARPKNRVIFAREGFTIVSVSWLMLSLISAIPFMVSGDIPRFADAFFASAQNATKGERVLLSPGGTAFDQFRDFEERGEVFCRLVKLWEKERKYSSGTS
jgi:trk system potassium uptake protein TrkH